MKTLSEVFFIRRCPRFGCRNALAELMPDRKNMQVHASVESGTPNNRPHMSGIESVSSKECPSTTRTARPNLMRSNPDWCFRKKHQSGERDGEPTTAIAGITSEDSFSTNPHAKPRHTAGRITHDTSTVALSKSRRDCLIAISLFERSNK